MTAHWQVQQAKQCFSEVLRAAAAGEPQIVTRHGQEVAVVLDIAEYRRLRGETLSLLEYLRAEPGTGVALDLGRSRDLPRDVDLAG